MSEVKWENLSDEELKKAVVFLIRPEWLKERHTMIAILESHEYTAEDAKDQLDEGEPLHNGPYLNLID